MKSFLTVGRSPGRGYNPRMGLEEAYKTLDWLPPIEFEHLIHTYPNHAPYKPRCVGSSAHMLLELYLDMDKSLYVGAGTKNVIPYFLVACVNRGHCAYLQEWLKTIHAKINLDVDLKKVVFFPTGSSTNSLRGITWYSWAIFCDHAVKELKGKSRNIGPYKYARSVERVSNGWLVKDRDHYTLGVLTDQGMKELVDASACPITLIQDDLRQSEVTYPALEDPAINPLLLLRRAFDR